MTLVRESARRSVFPLGEVLVTEAKVRVEGASGLGLVRGWDEAGAEDLAIIDASCRADLAVNLPWWEKLVAAEAQMEADRAVERTILETTRVDFQTMDQEART
jgi:alpha-D-ribose 1-methylphosphonate 5-triphosphate synthase subunit PhnG